MRKFDQGVWTVQWQETISMTKIYHRCYDLISKFRVCLKSLLHQGLSEPEFYGDLVYISKKNVGSNNFSVQFIYFS